MRALLRRHVVTGVACLAAMAVVPVAAAQGFARRVHIEPNAEYDGRFTFVRLRYVVHTRPGWEYDYPAMERNFMTIVNDLTTLRPHVNESNIHTMDDPALSKYSVAYLSEPGYWYPNEKEAAGLRQWLAKGGFLIVDDFLLGQWANFERSMRLVLPNARIVRLDVSHPIFNSFFHITTLSGMTIPTAGPRRRSTSASTRTTTRGGAWERWHRS